MQLFYANYNMRLRVLIVVQSVKSNLKLITSYWPFWSCNHSNRWKWNFIFWEFCSNPWFYLLIIIIFCFFFYRDFWSFQTIRDDFNNMQNLFINEFTISLLLYLSKNTIQFQFYFLIEFGLSRILLQNLIGQTS